ncbi:MAG TPA: choice-of-anchor D domain-containing protein [Candidatus Sulfotelmatobacter sp.]
MAFGSQPVGTPVPLVVTVSNSGAAALTISSDAVTGIFNSNFSKGADACTGVTLQPNDTCTVTVIFTPTIGNVSTGSSNRVGTLAIVSNASNALAFFNITGTAVQAVVGISAPSPSMNTGGTSVKNATITVSNTGGAVLNVTGVNVVKTAGPGSFTVNGGSCLPSASVPAGQSCTVAVSYDPTGSAASSTGHLVLTDTVAAATTQSGSNFNAN